MNEIVVDGEPLPYTEGQTVAAALVAAGRVAWRTTRVGHRPRGVFCGIGVCFDCLVTVDGARGQRLPGAGPAGHDRHDPGGRR